MSDITDTVEIDGLPISRLGFKHTLDRIARWCREDGFRRVATANLDFLTQARCNPELRQALRSADTVTADGQPMIWLSRLAGAPIEERVAGSDLALPLLQAVGRDRGSVYLLGSTDDVLDRVTSLLARSAPRLRVVGSFGGRVDLEDVERMEELVEGIRGTTPDLLLVALGCPKQDLFLSRYGRSTGAGVGIGVGATLDFLVGERRRAPRLLRRLGLEWLFRLSQEPLRLIPRYARNAWLLVMLVARNRFAQGGGTGARTSPPGSPGQDHDRGRAPA